MWHFSWILGAGLACAFTLRTAVRHGPCRERRPVPARSRR
ncbi:cytochrome bd-I oxidase subunit CydX [Geminicoccus harenae]|nr:cytochrome bd-I oxidase subunit CydX [Geminicoccus harenae]